MVSGRVAIVPFSGTMGVSPLSCGVSSRAFSQLLVNYLMLPMLTASGRSAKCPTWSEKLRGLVLSQGRTMHFSASSELTANLRTIFEPESPRNWTTRTLVCVSACSGMCSTNSIVRSRTLNSFLDSVQDPLLTGLICLSDGTSIIGLIDLTGFSPDGDMGLIMEPGWNQRYLWAPSYPPGSRRSQRRRKLHVSSRWSLLQCNLHSRLSKLDSTTWSNKTES